ncbi:hypothetical protein NYP20_12095 [Pseudomonas sp. N3-W]|uniref:hypothetical protein n=1 Tax=Pseudomonas sp. N3-W TaxID=2975049 RepID=UPI00217E2EF4|nr:hypothetical protein [Pseudomonas sp. N3-W]UWF51656.1 hypothetical protein NYP20_12095 [Pseudomonas sp. N3-W]
MTVNTTNSVPEFDIAGVNTLADLRAVDSARNKKAATLGYAARGDGGHGEYAVDEADTTSAESIPMIIVANDGARWKLIHDGNVSAEQCGFKRDGTVNTQDTLNSAIVAVTAAGARISWGYGTYVCEHIQLIPNMSWRGKGQFFTILKAKNGLNLDFISSNFTINTNNVSIVGMQFDGNRANNTSGHTFALKGAKQNLRQITLTQSAYHGLITDFDIVDGERPLGFESTYEDILIDTTGRHGWKYDGPTDSSMTNITLLDCGVSADNSWFGLVASRNFRANNLHPWNRSSTSNTPAASVYILASAPGCTAVNSHFEGGHCPLKILSNQNAFTDCDYYAPRGAYCLENYGTANKISGVLGATAASINPNYRGILMGGTGNMVDLTDGGCVNGAIDFTTSQGGNLVRVSGYRSSGVPFVGTPHPTDDVLLVIRGGGGGEISQAYSAQFSVFPTTVSAQDGTFTNATAILRLRKVGTIVFVQLMVTIGASGAGTATGNISVVLPYPCAAFPYQLSGSDSVSGQSIQGRIIAGGSSVRIFKNDNSSAIANATTLSLNGWYEAA